MAERSYANDLEREVTAFLQEVRAREAEEERKLQEAEERRWAGKQRPTMTAEVIGSPADPDILELMAFWQENHACLEGEPLQLKSVRKPGNVWTQTSPGIALSSLAIQAKRLEALQMWLKTDPDLFRFIDGTIGQRVKAAEQRQRVFSFGLFLLSFFSGWLLSALAAVAIFLQQHLIR